MEKSKRIMPKRFAPLIQEPIASQLWDFCEKTGSAPHVVVTLALHEWLKGHSKQKDRVA
jgi:hypothetical protein